MTVSRAVILEDDPKMLECIRFLAKLLRIRGGLDEAKKLLQVVVETSALKQGIFKKIQALPDYS